PRTTHLPYTTLFRSARLALIARQSSDAIMIRDLDGKISFCNPAVECLFGFSASELLGSSAERLVPQACAPQLTHIQNRVVSNKRDRKSTRLNSSHVK